MNDKSGDDGRKYQFQAASDKIRAETLPALERAYDENGPAVVLALTLMLADIWLESGFTASEWREIISLYDTLQGLPEVVT